VLIRDAKVPEEIPLVRALFEEYAASLDVDLCFQGFARELAELPGAYAQPSGCLLVATTAEDVVGCVGLRALDRNDASIGEIKRLYVRPSGRGCGTVRALAQQVIERAKAIRYRELRLDTLATMTAARRLYAQLGFRECPPYYVNPLAGVTYMSLALD